MSLCAKKVQVLPKHVEHQRQRGGNLKTLCGPTHSVLTDAGHARDL